ncbi:MAG: DJ-1/PfpI family protein [Alphaproteobacteria bacterium]
MSENTKNLPVAILVAAGFIEEHLTDTQKTLLASDHSCTVIAAEGGLVQGWHDNGWGHHFMAEDNISEVLSADFCGLIIPGGERSISTLVRSPHAIRLTKAFVEAEKPIAVFGAASRLLAEAGVAAGRRVTGAAGEQPALEQAGAQWVAESLVVDRLLVTADEGASTATVLNAFMAALASEPVEEAA